MSKGNDLATRKLAEDLANENWKIICTFLPSGWMEQARQCGALQRARGIPDAEKLLRLLLIHVVNGCSLSETAVRAAQMGLHVSAVAVFKRLQAAEEWLRWLAAQQLGTKRLRFENRGRPLRAVDATSVSEPGSTGTDWRVHYSISLADLRCDFFELTAIEHGGETLRRVPVHRGDIMMGDRIYANPVAVSHVVDAKGDILVRLNRQTLPLFDASEKRMDPLQLFGKIKAGQVLERVTRVRGRNGRQFYFPLGLRIGNTGAVDGEKLNSCFMNSAQQFCHLLDCRTY